MEWCLITKSQCSAMDRGDGTVSSTEAAILVFERGRFEKRLIQIPVVTAERITGCGLVVVVAASMGQGLELGFLDGLEFRKL